MLTLEKEKSLFVKGHQIICGLDEAGRGPLAGPVVAACVTVNSDFEKKMSQYEEITWIKDSKKISDKKRKILFDFINEHFFEVGVGICDHDSIDRINILQATFLAMKKSIGRLKNKPNFLLTDGKLLIPNISYQQEAIVGGDNLVLSIAAASIIAKVTRDNIMDKFHELYPAYGFDRHRGYGTKYHMEAIQEHGPCPIHRKTFKPISNFF